MDDQVRSRRSVAPRVVVVGGGPVAAGVAAGLGTDLVAEVDEQALAGAGAMVVVAYEAGRAASGAASQFGGVADALEPVRAALTAASGADVPHVVLVTSAVVHGAEPGRPDIDDDDPLTVADERWEQGLVAELLAVDAAFAEPRGAWSPLRTVLRVAPVVGPGVDTLVGRNVEPPRLLEVRGSDRRWQFVHLDDLAAAVRLVLDRALVGAFTVGAGDALSTEEVARAAGLRRLTLPAGVAFGLAERLHRVGALRTPPAELAFVVYSWTVTARGLRAAGWQPVYSSAQCLDQLVEQIRDRRAAGERRLGARDAAAGALGVGAAVALAATAAAVRRARR